MKHHISFFKGIIWLSIEGEQLERFFNLCKNNHILLEHISMVSCNHVYAQMNASDFYKLIPLRRKTNIHIHILQKYGLPFFFFKNKKRKAFFLGVLIFFILIICFTCRIWSIQIQGNTQISTKEILSFLESNNITHGISKKHVDCGAIAQTLREQYPLTTWISVKLEGTKLLIAIQEGLSDNMRENISDPCNVTANKEGTIIDMITRSGIPSVKIGDTCKKGDLLISGCIEILNDNKEVIRYDYVHADGDIFIKYKLPYYKKIPVTYKHQADLPKTNSGFFIQLYNWYMDFGIKHKKNRHTTINYYSVNITENFKIPVSFGKCVQKEYTLHNLIYSEEEIVDIAWKTLKRYEQNLLEKGVQISANNVKIEVTDKICVSSGYLEVIEKIGIETPLAIKEPLEIERNTTNG